MSTRRDPRGGRPKKPEHERLSEVFQIRFTPSDMEALYAAARRRGSDLRALLRRQCLRLLREDHA